MWKQPTDLSSICQVGIASFRDGRVHNLWESLVNPEDDFDPIDVSIYGIDEEDVQFSPNWTAVYSKRGIGDRHPVSAARCAGRRSLRRRNPDAGNR